MLTVKSLTKVFGGFTAVSSVDFSVEKGEILGLIGPNGSGKSTIFYKKKVLIIFNRKCYSTALKIGFIMIIVKEKAPSA